MEKYSQNDIKETFMPELLLIGAEINFISERIGLGMRKGFQFVTDEVNIEQLVRGLRENGCIEFPELRSREVECFNFELSFHVHAKSDRLNDLNRFLLQKKFLTGVIVNLMPLEELREFTIPLRIREADQFKICDTKFQEKMNEIRKFVRSNPEIVVREVQLIKSRCSSAQSDFERAFRASAAVYLEFFRNTHSEEDVVMERRIIEDQIRMFVLESVDLYAEIDMLDVIMNVCNQYLSMDPDYTMKEIDSIDQVTEKAIKDGNAIIYDKNFYYICEKLFRKACEKLLETVSHIEIKWELRKENVLVCNEISENNFTIKKNYLNCSGKVCRDRFLKFDKRFFISKDGLSLEERKGSVDAKEENVFKHHIWK